MEIQTAHLAPPEHTSGPARETIMGPVGGMHPGADHVADDSPPGWTDNLASAAGSLSTGVIVASAALVAVVAAVVIIYYVPRRS